MLKDLHATIPNNPLASQLDPFINRLSSALLSRIFELGSKDIRIKDKGDEVGEDDDDEEYEDDEDDTLFQFPISVSHVCHHWRSVALSTPSLWTTIKLREARPPYDLLSMLLGRSKALPIDIDCYLGDSEQGDEHLEDAMSLFDVLASHVHRWRTMRLFVLNDCYMCSFFRAVSNPSIAGAPKLMVLDLRCKSHGDVSQKLAPFGGSVPLLTKLVLLGVDLDWSLPWVASALNLKELNLEFHTHSPSWAQFASLLRSTSALESLILRSSGPYGNPAEWFIESTPGSSGDPDARIPLPFLTHLHLTLYSEACAIGLVRRLHLPALKSLSLDFLRGCYDNFIQELARPAAHAYGQPRSLLSGLEKLTLRGLHCHHESVKVLCGELQNLTTLDLLSPWVFPIWLTDILCTPCTFPGRSVWLPRLVRLRVSTVGVESLRKLVKKRIEQGVPLEYLELGDSIACTEEEWEWFKENVKEFK